MPHDEYPEEESSARVELPDGVFPPMPGYTTEDLVAAAYERTRIFLEAQNIEPGLMRETLIALVTQLYAVFEENGLGYQIATWYQKPYDQPGMRIRSVASVAEEFGAIALKAAAYSLRGSQLLRLGKQFYGDFMDQAGNAVRDHILKLNVD